jgi:hypothetical protein
MSSAKKGINRVEISACICMALEAHDIPYSVAHGIEHYPSKLGRDIDIAVPSKGIPAALGVIASAAKRASWHIVALQKRVLGHYRLFLRSLSGHDQLEVDLLPNLSWGPLVIFESVSASERNGPFLVDPWISFAKRVLLQVLAGNFRRFVNRRDELVFHSGERNAAVHNLSGLLGPTLVARFIEAVDMQEVARLRALGPSLRLRIGVATLTCNPLGGLKGLGYWAVTQWQNSALSPCVIPIVHITGLEEEFVEDFLHRLEVRVKNILPITTIHGRLLRHRHDSRSLLLSRLNSILNYIQDRRASANLVLPVTVRPLDVNNRNHSVSSSVWPVSHVSWDARSRDISSRSYKPKQCELSAWQDSQVDDVVKAIDEAFLCLNALTASHPL